MTLMVLIESPRMVRALAKITQRGWRIMASGLYSQREDSGGPFW